jgi:hypothetical protein
MPIAIVVNKAAMARSAPRRPMGPMEPFYPSSLRDLDAAKEDQARGQVQNESVWMVVASASDANDQRDATFRGLL